ncbi:MAG: MATE family efflux transporter [Oscillospiraceae bacterium]|nr:MATE family efflux transporter [Oscillospiraceae bacterium]
MTDAAEAKYIRMTTQPVEKLILKLAVPTIISMLVTAFYNLADTFFIRQLDSDSMVAAVGVVLPLMNIIQAIGFYHGHGSGNYISRAFGRQDLKDAEKMAATGFFCALSFGILLAALGLCFRRSFVMILGAKTEETVENSIRYMQYILLAAPLMMGSIVMNNQLRFQGNAFFSMIGLTSGAVVNLILDPILIFRKGQSVGIAGLHAAFGAGMGVSGAALATALSQCLSFVILAIGLSRSDNVKIRLKNFCPKPYYLKGIMQGGLPSLARQGIGSLATASLNHSIGLYLTGAAMIDAAQAAMTGVNRIMMLLASVLIGFGQGFQPVCGFNYGAKLYDRVKKAFGFCVKLATVVLILMAAVFFVLARPVTNLVAGASPEAAQIAVFAFRAQLVTLPLLGWIILCNMMLQNIGATAKATLLALARQGLSFIPMILLLPSLMQGLGPGPLLGIELAQPAADVISFAIAIPVGLSELKKMRTELQQSGLKKQESEL